MDSVITTLFVTKKELISFVSYQMFYETYFIEEIKSNFGVLDLITVTGVTCLPRHVTPVTPLGPSAVGD